MTAPRIILASLPSFCQQLSKLVEIWRSSDKNNFAQFFETWCTLCRFWYVSFSAVPFLWLPCVADTDIIFLPRDFYLSFFYLFSSPNLSGRRLDVCHTSTHGVAVCGLSANLECMSEMCCTQLAENTGHKKSPSWHHRTTWSGHTFTTKACIDNRKKWLNINTSSTCLHNMVNFGSIRLRTVGEFGSPQQISTCFVSWQCYCMVLQQWASAKLCGIEQRAPPIFGRAAITLGIDPHSSVL